MARARKQKILYILEVVLQINIANEFIKEHEMSSMICPVWH